MRRMDPTDDTFRPLDPRGSPPGFPVYRMEVAGGSIFYVPGTVAFVRDGHAEELERLLTGREGGENHRAILDDGRTLLDRARRASAAYAAFYDHPFEPVCLTLYLHNKCNLACEYCLLTAGSPPTEKLRRESVLAAGRVVAETCRRKGLPFYTVFHGWGEPAYDFRLLQELVEAVDRISEEYKLSRFRYIATNGVLPAEVAGYICERFDNIGLSCDGPDHFHDAQRPRRGGKPTSGAVRRTAALLRKAGKRFGVRSTITPRTMAHQAEVADYILRELQPREIRFEPVYRPGKDGFMPEDTEPFTTHFFEAEAAAAKAGVELSFSGGRLREIHGPYCNVFRDVLMLLPQGGATVCFAHSAGNENVDLIIGGQTETGFTFAKEKIAALSTRLSRRPDACRLCFNNYHCVGLCPDICPLDTEAVETIRPDESFRCRVQKVMALRRITHAAEAIRESMSPVEVVGWRPI
jgi:sulfatase maturation enzyme AslB (radical SAM superfamily)